MILQPSYLKGFTRNLYRFIKEGHVIKLEKMKGFAGSLDLLESTGNPAYVVQVRLDYREDIISTFVHEFFHYRHPEWVEEDVIKAEVIIMNTLTRRQAKNILKRLAEVI